MAVRIGVSACAAAAAIALSACGGEDGGGELASLAPATTPVYVEGVLRPSGQLKADVEDLFATVTGEQDPGGRLVEYLDRRLSAGDVSYSQDIEPWLGEHAAIFIEGFAGDDEDGALILETTDSGAAQNFIDKLADSEPDVEGRSYEGVDYSYDPADDQALAIVDDFLVFGDPEAALKDAIDAADGTSLADQSAYKEAIGGAPGGSLADVYLDLESFAGAVKAELPDDERQLFEGALGETRGKTALASLVPGADSIEVDLRSDAGAGIQPADLSPLIGSFPSDSFAAIGVPDVGRAVRRAIDKIERSGIEGVTPGAIDRQLSLAGLSLNEVTSTLGDVGAFLEGTDAESLEGAIVITTADENAASELVGKLTDLALRSGEPGVERVGGGTGFSVRDPDLGSKPLILLTAGDRIAIGYGEDATEKALSTAPVAAGNTLAGDSTYREATEALDDVELSGYLAVAPILELAEDFGAAEDPGYEAAKPYLKRFSYLVFGTGRDGDFATAKVVAGVEK